MSKHPGKAPFRPGLRGMIWGTLIFLTGLALLVHGAGMVSATTTRSFALMAAGCALAYVGALMLKHAAARLHGQRVEANAVKKLAKVLPPGYTMANGVLFAGLGDLDIVIDAQDGSAGFVIEVKSQEGVKVASRFPLGRGAKLLAADGSKLRKDPLGQVCLQAQRTGKSPVLWFPQATKPRVDRLKVEGVLVVQGNERLLLRALGLRRTMFARLLGR